MGRRPGRAGRLPETGTFSALLNVTNADRSASRQLGAKWHDGELICYFIFDSAQAPQQQNLDGLPIVDGKVVTAAFPWTAVSDLGAVWNWALRQQSRARLLTIAPSQGGRAQPQEGAVPVFIGTSEDAILSSPWKLIIGHWRVAITLRYRHRSAAAMVHAKRGAVTLTPA
jgi:hypothetical protein